MAKRIMGANSRPVRYESETIKGKLGIRGRVELENGSMVIHDYPYLATLYKLFDEMIHEPLLPPDPNGRTPFSAYCGMCNNRFKNLVGVVIRCHVYRSVIEPNQQYPVRYVVKSITGSESLIDAKASASDALVLLTSESLCSALDCASRLHQSYLEGEYGHNSIGEQCIILAIYNDYSYSAYFGKDPEVSITNFKRVHGMVPYVPRKKDAMNSSVAAYRSALLPVKKSFVRSEDGFLVIR